MRPTRTGHASQDCSTNRAVWIYLLSLCAFTLTFIVAFEYVESISPLNAPRAVPGTLGLQLSTAPAALDLGFPYPQLSRARELLRAAAIDIDLATASIAYSSALAKLQQQLKAGKPDISSNHTAAGTPHYALELFLTEAVGALATGTGHLQCQQDPTLLAAWQPVTATSPISSRAVSQHSSVAPAADKMSTPPRNASNKYYLLAANFHNSAAVLPNFIVQTLRLALLLPPAHLAVSVYESGSSDTTRMWLTLLHYMLLPLKVPHNITTAGMLSPRLGLSRIELLARLRNALIEPWLEQQQQQSRLRVQQPEAAAAGRIGRVRRPAAAAAAAGSAELSYLPGSFHPDTLIFANDVFLCAEDVLRLFMHDAHIACGMDFYTAPWQQEAVAVAATAGGNSSSSSSGLMFEDADDFFDPETMQLQQQSSGTGGHSNTAPRFYDKWVARDITGHRLRNRHPFIKHAPSLLQLSAGQPVPMRCCWNGLVALTAAPLTHRGVRFRTHQPGECSASECSLLCHDLLRLGFTHIVMDPGVRLTYELDQVNMLGGAAVTAVAGETAAEKGVSGDRQHVTGLGPWLPWADVAATSARLAVKSAAAATTSNEQQQDVSSNCSIMMECCDLQPGHSYVNFAKDCHMVDIMAQNHTAAAAQAA